VTLLINEIHIRGNLKKCFILFAADSRITVNGEYHSTRKKIFEIPYLNSGIGYFGLGQINNRVFLSDWISNFILHNSSVTTQEDLAKRLCDQLNINVDKDLLASNPSGIHVCGFNGNNYPELWFVRNIQDMEGNIYKNFSTEYFISEDFLGRDAKQFGFNGNDPKIFLNPTQYYINGDVRPFHSVWNRLDKFLHEMNSYDDFNISNSPADYQRVAKWKMEVISSFYKQFANKEIIGRPIDTFILEPNAS
jgi:hypothetical protein